MANIALSDLLTDLKASFAPGSDSVSNAVFNDNWYTRRCNEALNKVVQDFMPPQYETTYSFNLVASQKTYSFTTADPKVLSVISVANQTTSRVLELLTPLEADNFWGTYTGEPGFFLVFGEALELYPMPNSSYSGNVIQIRYLARPTQFDSSLTDTEVPLPEWLNRPLLVLAKAFCFSDGNEPARAATEFGQYQSLLGSTKSPRAREFARSRSFTRPTRSF